MSESWANSAERLGIDIHLDLRLDPNVAVRRSLAEALRQTIREGRLSRGAQLPPYRSLAADLGLARNTVSAVYQDLVAEGWLVAHQGSGTRVAPDAGPLTTSRAPAPTDAAAAPEFDFQLGHPAASLFPRSDWLSATKHVLTHAADEAFTPQDPQGRIELRSALAEYLGRSRGVLADPRCIVIDTGFMAMLPLLARALGWQHVGVDSYSLPMQWSALEHVGVTTLPIPMDDDGVQPHQVPPQLDAILTTPTHQYPTGVMLAPERRGQLVGAAPIIVEDDYDGELRYDRQPVRALQGLAPDQVIYLGSVSKSLTPAVRVGWMVLPPKMVDKVLQAKGIREESASVIDQLILARMITTGAFDRHIRRSRMFYRRRRDELVSVMNAHGMTVSGISAGLAAVVPVDDEPAVAARAWTDGVRVYGLSFFRHPAAFTQLPPAMVVGFGAPPPSQYTRAVTALANTLTRQSAGSRAYR